MSNSHQDKQNFNKPAPADDQENSEASESPAEADTDSTDQVTTNPSIKNS